jgi:hypothetical protein
MPLLMMALPLLAFATPTPLPLPFLQICHYAIATPFSLIIFILMPLFISLIFVSLFLRA